MPGRLRPALEQVRAADQFTPTDLDLDPQSCLVLCRRLVREGLLEVVGVSAPFRCAAASGLRDEPVAGTASTVRPFLLVENPGPWGVDALRDNRLPQRVKGGLAAAARAAGVRVLFIRRHHRRAPRAGFHVFAAYADPVTPWMESALLARSEDLLDLDLAALGAGRSPGLTRVADSLFCVCTHGRHDACCAERGRPVAAALTAAHPDQTWEVSHIGGDRFSGNLLVLPHGLYYGRLDAVSSVAVGGAHLAGQLDLDHLRGRSGLPMAVQAAEIALRRDRGETREDAVRPLGSRTEAGETVALFGLGGAAYEVRLRTDRVGDLYQLTCQATRENPVPRHDVLGIRRLSQAPVEPRP